MLDDTFVAQEPVRAVSGEVAIPQRPSLQERLEAHKRHLEQQLADVNKALDMLRRHPQAAEMLNTLSRLRYSGF